MSLIGRWFGHLHDPSHAHSAKNIAKLQEEQEKNGRQINGNDDDLMFDYGDENSDEENWSTEDDNEYLQLQKSVEQTSGANNKEELSSLQKEYSAKESELIRAAHNGADNATILKLNSELAEIRDKINSAETNSAPRDKNLKGVSELGEGHYKVNGKTRAEDSLPSGVLDKTAATLDKNNQLEVLKKAGIDVSKLTANEAQDGTVSFNSGNQHYRVVAHKGDLKIISTTIEGDNASTVVYKVGDTKQAENTKNTGNTGNLSEAQINQLAQDVANGEKIFFYRDENGKLGANPKFKNLDDETLSSIINKSKSLKANTNTNTNKVSKNQKSVRSSSQKNSNVNSEANADIKKLSLKIDIQNKKIEELQNLLNESSNQRTNTNNQNNYNQLLQEKRELEAEQRKIQKQIDNYNKRLGNNRQRNNYNNYNYYDNYNSNNSRNSFFRTGQGKSGIEELNDGIHDVTNTFDGINRLVDSFDRLIHGGHSSRGWWW